MNITKEETGTLTASVKVSVGRQDYETKLQETLKDYQKKASMPGFRPGKVPFGLISKMYRKAVLLDEVNRLVAEGLQNYIAENDLKLLGNPLPNREKSPSIDLDEMTDFDFYFDIGLAPEFELDLTDQRKADYITIKATDKMVDEYIIDLQKRYGVHHHHDDDNAAAAAEETQDIASQQSHDPASHDDHIEPAELNEEFFKRIFPMDDIKDEATFRDKVREGIERSLVRDSDQHFMNSVIEDLVENTSIDLPDTFIRRMLKENEENAMTDEEIDAQYENFARSVKWQLIESRIVKDHGLSVDAEEMRNVVRSYFTGGIPSPEESPEQNERLNKIVDSVLSNQEEASRLHGQLFDKKMLDFFKSTIQQKQKEMDYDAFVKMITDKKK
jgi:trigger factor